MGKVDDVYRKLTMVKLYPLDLLRAFTEEAAYMTGKLSAVQEMGRIKNKRGKYGGIYVDKKLTGHDYGELDFVERVLDKCLAKRGLIENGSSKENEQQSTGESSAGEG